MNHDILRVTVPGKLMIAGEYAVLERDQKAAVTAVDRFITVTVSQSTHHSLSLPNLSLEDVTWQYSKDSLHFNKSDNRLSFIKQALSVVYEYLENPKALGTPFHVTIESELDSEEGHKYGLGSSAAVVVGVVAALLHLVREDPPSLGEIFKLSAVAHFRAQGSGSGADIAASTYGGWLCYSSFHPQWLRDRLASKDSLAKIIRDPWPHFSVTRLTLPPELSLCVGWTKTPASTGPLVQTVQQFKDRHPKNYEEFLQGSSSAVQNLIRGFDKNDNSLILKSITQNCKVLRQLGEEANIPIETSKLATLANLAEDHGGAGKPSGAGAGDCGIVLIANRKVEQLNLAWLEAGIQPLSLQNSNSGVKERWLMK